MMRVRRLIAGILAAQPFLTVVNGDESLRSRPMDRVIDPLRAMGAPESSKVSPPLKAARLSGVTSP